MGRLGWSLAFLVWALASAGRWGCAVGEQVQAQEDEIEDGGFAVTFINEEPWEDAEVFWLDQDGSKHNVGSIERAGGRMAMTSFPGHVFEVVCPDMPRPQRVTIEQGRTSYIVGFTLSTSITPPPLPVPSPHPCVSTKPALSVSFSRLAYSRAVQTAARPRGDRITRPARLVAPRRREILGDGAHELLHQRAF